MPHVTRQPARLAAPRLLCLLTATALTLAAQQRPPVVLVDGYHLTCDSGAQSSTDDYGELEQLLKNEGLQTAFFGTCSLPGKPPIEDLAAGLGNAIASLNAAQVDVISFSMGGLVVRAYLSGKQKESGVFQPPASPRIRKWISIATPNFGALLPPVASVVDAQVAEMVPGSQFLFDLATWNQHRDNLREVDALAIAGNAGGLANSPILSTLLGTSDGTVSVTSASLLFATSDERTRVIPYCHGANSFTVILGGGCTGPGIADITSTSHPSWIAIDSFLAGGDGWRSVGHAPSQDPILSQYGGTITQQRDASDNPSGSPQSRDLVKNAPRNGTFTAAIDKAGPFVAYVAPAAALVGTIDLAPREIVSLYGPNLDNATVSLGGTTLTVFYNGSNQINALLPDGLSGLQTLELNNASGLSHTNIMLDTAAPAIFTLDQSGTGAAAAIYTGNYVSLFLTGLGDSTTDVNVYVNGAQVATTYIGPAPGFPGLDQINFQLPQGVMLETHPQVTVTAGGHTSNAVVLQNP